jgi:hypothetical protein
VAGYATCATLADGASDLRSVLLKKGDGDEGEGDASVGFRGLRAAGMRAAGPVPRALAASIEVAL